MKTISTRKIDTHYWPKPIPMRSADWESVEEDYDLGRPVGRGATQAEAIADLQQQLDDEYDAQQEGQWRHETGA